MNSLRKVVVIAAALFSFFAFAVPASAAVEVPSGYSILEYIESSGTQYIDTGFTVSSSNFRDLRFEIDQTVSSSGVSVSGTGAVSPVVYIGVIDGVLYYGNGTSDVSLGVSYDNARHNFVLDVKNNKVEVSGLADKIVNFVSIEGSRSLYLFGYNSGSGAITFSGKLYGSKISDNGTLVRDYVPVKNLSNEVGLFDKVTGQFIGNSGTGSFSAGPVVEVVPSVQYSVTVNDSYASNTGAGSYYEGDTVSISAGTRDGYIFTGWTSSVTLADSTAATTSFTMPAQDVTVTANWEVEGPPPPTYAVTVNDSYASNTGAGSYTEGTTVTIRAGEREGYLFGGWTSSVTLSDSSSATTSFTMPAEPVIVTATWEDIPDPSDFDGWTSIETHYLFSGGDSWTLNATSVNADNGAQSRTFYGSSGSYGGRLDNRELYDGVYSQDHGRFQFRATIGGMLLEKGKTYRLRYTSYNPYRGLFDPIPVFDNDTYQTITATSSLTAETRTEDIVFKSLDDQYIYFIANHSLSAYQYGTISGRLDMVEPTASGDSYSSTTSDIANKQEQITQIEEEIFTDLELYSSQVDINAATNFPSGMLNAVSFIGSTWTEAFNQLGEFQTIITFPLFLGIALLFIGRASSVIVSGSMRSRKNNDKQGGGDIG